MKQHTPYSDYLLEHARSTTYRRPLERETARSAVQHPSCGDRIVVYATIEDNVVTDVGFEAQGCLLSQAAASLYLTYIHGKSVDEILALTPHDMLQKLDLALGPKRAECALLIYQAVQQMLQTANNT